MHSLLRWAVENSEPANGLVRQPQAIDPGVIDVILGRPDSVLMKEDMGVATDVNRTEEDRVAALEDFEIVSDDDGHWLGNSLH
jgi:hsp70-interacting protein